MNDENKKHSSKINIKAIKVGEGNSSDELKKAKIASHGIIAKDKKGEILTTVEGHNYGKEKIKETISENKYSKKVMDTASPVLGWASFLKSKV